MLSRKLTRRSESVFENKSADFPFSKMVDTQASTLLGIIFFSPTSKSSKGTPKTNKNISNLEINIGLKNRTFRFVNSFIEFQAFLSPQFCLFISFQSNN